MGLFCAPNKEESTSRNVNVIPVFLEILFLLFLSLLLRCDTCDSKKTTLLLEGARVHACVRRSASSLCVAYENVYLLARGEGRMDIYGARAWESTLHKTLLFLDNDMWGFQNVV